MSESEDDRDAELKAIREKFDNIKKIEVSPLITRADDGSSESGTLDLRSPDDLQPKWHDDPEEILAERRSRARIARRNKKNEARDGR